MTMGKAFIVEQVQPESSLVTTISLPDGFTGSVTKLLSEGRTHLEAEDAKVAVFYSISNCQKGLTGISFGNLLIKQVVAELSHAFPQLESFVTKLVETGRYNSKSEVLREGIRLIQEREARLSVLDLALARGLDDAQKGRIKPMTGVV